MDKYREAANEAEKITNLSPTDNQKIKGNYRKGSFTLFGMKITIENAKGSTRKGVDPDGKSWECTMNNTYGYFNNTIGNDGDQIDVYLGDDLANGKIFVIDQLNKDKSFDEHKIMFGFEDKDLAEKEYNLNFEKGWGGMGTITEVRLSTLKNWIYNKQLKNKPFVKLKNRWRSVSKVDNYGVTKIVKLYGEIKFDESYYKFVKDVEDLGYFDTVIVDIRSGGGAVQDGLQIANKMCNLSRDGKQVVTLVSANADSIASVIALMGDYRFISSYGRIMIHNPMIPLLEYANAKELEEEASLLRELEEMLSEVYCSFTNLSIEAVKKLMDEETFFNAEKSLEYGFSDEIIKMEKKTMVMSSSKSNEENKMSGVNGVNKLKRIIGRMSGSKVVNQIYNTMDGDLIEIFQADGSMYSEGDRVGTKEGEFQLADGAILVVADNVIKEIKQAPVEPVIEEPVSVEEPIIVEPVEPVIEDSNLGETPEVPGEPVSEVPTEKPTEPVSEVPTEEPVIEEPVSETSTPVEPETEDKPILEFDPNYGKKLEKKLTTLEVLIEELVQKVSELQTQPTEVQKALQENVSKIQESMGIMDEKVKEFGEFEVAATKAIETISESTSSVWEPVVARKAKAVDGPKLSIFQQAKRDAFKK